EVNVPKIYVCNSSALCGCSRTPAILARIVGGEEAYVDTWDWTVFLHVGNQSCGGSIISASWILTAAHCVAGLNANQITVYAGSNKKWAASQNKSVSTIVAHPGYVRKPTYIVNDIALIRLSTPLNLTDPHVSVICVPSINSSVLSSGEWLPSNTTVVAVGWGRLTEAGQTSSTLQQVTIKTIDRQSLLCSYVSNFSTQLCAGAPGKGIVSHFYLMRGE
ncbi:unnamed protein product, partial [Adineta steineri]